MAMVNAMIRATVALITVAERESALFEGGMGVSFPANGYLRCALQPLPKASFPMSALPYPMIFY